MYGYLLMLIVYLPPNIFNVQEFLVMALRKSELSYKIILKNGVLKVVPSFNED